MKPTFIAISTGLHLTFLCLTCLCLTCLCLTCLCLTPSALQGAEKNSKKAERNAREKPKPALKFPRVDQIFHRLLDEHSRTATDNLATAMRDVPRSKIEEVRRHILKKLHQLDPVAHVKSALLQGLGPALTIAATEFTSIIILPAICLHFDKPALATFFIGSPTFLVTLPVYYYLANLRQQKKIEQALGIGSIQLLDQLRLEIIGYAHQKRIMSILVETANEKIEIDVVNASGKAMWKQFTSTENLESFARKATSSKHIKTLDHHKNDPRLYAIHLLQLIATNQKVYRQFVHDITQKNRPKGRISEHRNTLIAIHDQQMATEELTLQIRKLRQTLHATLKQGLPRNHYNVVDERLKGYLAHAESLAFDLTKSEYRFLHTLKHNPHALKKMAFTVSKKSEKRLENLRYGIKSLSPPRKVVHHKDFYRKAAAYIADHHTLCQSQKGRFERGYGLLLNYFKYW